MKHIIRKLIPIFLLLFTLAVSCVKEGNTQTNKVHITSIDELKKEILWKEAYERALDTIKKYEGYRAYPYYCPAGVLTVGYGHTLQYKEYYRYPMNKHTADSVLRIDFNSVIQYVQENTGLGGYKLLAISIFTFNVGKGNFEQSTLKQLLDKGKPIDDEIIKWVYVKKGNRYRFLNGLLSRRVAELKLFKEET